ncbi:MAG TPA: SRPBCC family protein [Chitinophagaceae bacterium]|nr:SRPBCC family protein [Chitinophagaceae bacterium]
MKNNIKAEVSIDLHATVATVWDALTKPALIKQYFFGTNTVTDWKVGHPIRFNGEWEGKHYEDKGQILDILKKKFIKYDYWSSMSGIEDKPENYVIITYALSGKDNDVTLTVLQENIPDEKTKEHSVENWKKVLAGLKDLVEKKLVVSGEED